MHSVHVQTAQFVHSQATVGFPHLARESRRDEGNRVARCTGSSGSTLPRQSTALTGGNIIGGVRMRVAPPVGCDIQALKKERAPSKHNSPTGDFRFARLLESLDRGGYSSLLTVAILHCVTFSGRMHFCVLFSRQLDLMRHELQLRVNVVKAARGNARNKIATYPWPRRLG